LNKKHRKKDHQAKSPKVLKVKEVKGGYTQKEADKVFVGNEAKNPTKTSFSFRFCPQPEKKRVA